MKKISSFVPISNLIIVYQSIVEPYFNYCSIVWDNISDHLTEKLQELQNHASIYPFIHSFKVAEHSFQVPMPNSPLLLNYL